MDIEIRETAVDDMDELSRVALASFDAHIARDFKPAGVAELHRFFSADAIRQRATRNHQLWIALDGNAIVGMLELRPPSHLLSLFVEPSSIGQGIGRMLVARCVRHVRACRPEQTILTVNSAPSSVPAYRRMGFRSTGEAFEENHVRSFPMAVDLNPTTR